MSTGIGEIKDEFLTKILGIDSYKIKYPELYKTLSINKKSNCFEYVRLGSGKASLINDFCSAGFYIVCQEFEFIKDVRSFRDDSMCDACIIDVCYPAVSNYDFVSHMSSKFARIFKHDRFFKDKYINPLAFDIKKQWICNIFSGRFGDILLFALDSRCGELVGFMSVNKVKDKQYRIDLISVLEEHQGKGAAYQLIQEFCLCDNIDEVVVSTQASNYPAISLYKKMGFKMNQVYTVLHRFNKGDS